MATDLPRCYMGLKYDSKTKKFSARVEHVEEHRLMDNAYAKKETAYVLCELDDLKGQFDEEFLGYIMKQGTKKTSDMGDRGYIELNEAQQTKLHCFHNYQITKI